MLFKPELCEKILKGEKTQTRRIKKSGERFVDYLPGGKAVFTERRTKWVVGQTYAICPGRGKPAVGRIRLLDIREERVKDISEADAIVEGVDKNCPGDWQNCPGCLDLKRCDAEGEYIRYPVELNESYQAFSAAESFLSLWNSIYTKPGQRVEDNPEVWVLVFELEGD
jgi:uncharacterized protein YhfF